jgi:hypothetical protein
VRWIEDDVTGTWNVPPVDVWHDRAVFHFLTDPADRARYVKRARDTIRPGGALIVATFGPGGPERCSGLPCVRYSPQSLGETLEDGFRLQETVREIHRTPSGFDQEFLYSRFSRSSASG